MAIIEIDAAMRAGRLRHDGNPVLEWCLGNVVGTADRRGNLYPSKQRSGQKIDAVALMMAVGRTMTGYDDAGLKRFIADPLIVGRDVIEGKEAQLADSKLGNIQQTDVLVANETA